MSNYTKHRSTESIRFQPPQHGKEERAVYGCQGQDCRPAQAGFVCDMFAW